MTDITLSMILAFPSMPQSAFQLLIHGDLARELPDFMERFAVAYGNLSACNKDTRIKGSWYSVLEAYDDAVGEKTP